MTVGFVEIADRVFVLRYPVLDVNVTLLVGDGAALLVDTLSTVRQATELAGAVRAVTPHPWAVVNTHHHFDHCFGNRTLAADPACPVYAHEVTARLLRDQPDEVRRQAHAEMLPEHPVLAAELATTRLLAPTVAVHTRTTLDVGGRSVLLRHPGRGHTAGDLVVYAPDADVLVAGDLVEESGPPAFEESFPLDWPAALATLIGLSGPATVVVPGRGSVVDLSFARAQHAELTELAGLIRAGYAAGRPPGEVAAAAPFGPESALVAVRRGYAQLAAAAG
ncbi:MBL fold metallo-hydrolase [Micromonospora echinofusca]|uniref:MBL fold metallo-hydrolase n=1 Tax=Micromonospora echinofusca TaxID=47858 RepID=A0ABS3W0N0_MICEH|nr:MBL fold metallo-hydrolase [Micromonospora echinofusca]MBO4210351.1 MBL fold metallo-hydrolase [Micromonospora echinofusca]